MNRFVVALSCLACASGAPTYATLGHSGVVGVGAAGVVGRTVGAAVAHGAPVVSAPAVVGQTHQTYAAGPAQVESRVEYGVVGSQVVQTGLASVVGGYQHVPAGQEVIPQPSSTYLAGAPQTHTVTNPLPAPVIPAAAPYVAAIPPAPVPAGPAPADTVTQQRILAPVRTHTRITPQQTNIIPKVEVTNYNVDLPIHVPVPVEREVIVNKHVPAPYNVPVPRAVPVPAPYKVHPVQEIVETPHVHHATYTTHHKQPIVTSHAVPVHETVNVPVQTVQDHVAHGVAYAQAAPAVAVAAPAYAHAGYAHAGYAHAAAPAVAVGHAGYATTGLIGAAIH